MHQDNTQDPKQIFILHLLVFQTQIKTLHWQTQSYAEHKAFGRFYENLDELVDKLIECYQGKFGLRLQVPENADFKVFNYDRIQISKFLNRYYQFLNVDVYELGIITQNDLDIQDIIISILNEINRLNYLLTLK